MQVVITGTRNLYPWFPCMYMSLFSKNPDAHLWIFAENAQLPYETPDNITVVDVSKQTLFKLDGPNARSPFTYMAMIRAAFSMLLIGEPNECGVETLPRLDKIISLDVDTIVCDSLRPIWETDFSNGEWFAAVPEYQDDSRVYGRENRYRNAGCMVMNLEQMRRDGVAEKAIALLNKQKFTFLDEQVLNLLNMAEGDTKCVDLHPRWNQTENGVTLTLDVGICHYAGYKDVWKQPPENVYRWHYLEPWLKYAKEAECAAAGIKF